MSATAQKIADAFALQANVTINDLMIEVMRLHDARIKAIEEQYAAIKADIAKLANGVSA